jgi:hypothetical protein
MGLQYMSQPMVMITLVIPQYSTRYVLQSPANLLLCADEIFSNMNSNMVVLTIPTPECSNP